MGSKFWLLIFSVLVAWSEAKRRLKKQVNENDLEKHKELVLSIHEVNKTQFFEQDTDKGEYQFGYQISPDGNFHHENRAPDGVTYGCYGYVDAYGTPVEYYYISDGWGYRTVMPNTPVEVFYHAHDPDSHSHNSVEGNQVDGNENAGDHGNGHGHHEHHEHHGEIVPWGQLHFPKQCENQGFTLPPPPPQSPGSVFPSQPSQGNVQGASPTQPSKPGITGEALPERPQPETPDQSITVPQQPSPTQKPGQISGGGTFPGFTGQTSTELPGQSSSSAPGAPIAGFPGKPDFTGQPPSQYPEKPLPTQSVLPDTSTTQPGIPSQPPSPVTTGSVVPERPDTGVSSQTTPGYSGSSPSIKPSVPDESQYPVKPSSTVPAPNEFSTELLTESYRPGLPSRPKPGISGSEISGQQHQGSGPLPTGQPVQPSQPLRPQTGFPGSLPTSYPGQPSQPTEYPGQPNLTGTSGIGYPGQTQTGQLPTESHEQSYQPEAEYHPSQPIKPGPSLPGIPEQPQPEILGEFPTQYPGQPSQPVETVRPGHTQKPQSELPGSRPTAYPGTSRPSELGSTIPGYPEHPQTEFTESLPTGQPGQTLQPTQSTLYPGYPTQPSRPGTGAGYPQTGSPTGYPSQPTQPSKPGTTASEYPGKPQTGISGSFPTSHPEQPTKPPVSGTSGTGHPGQAETVVPGQAPNGYPEQLTSPSTSGTGYPGHPGTLVPGQSGYPSQPTQPTGPETSGTGYPGQQEPVVTGQSPNVYPGQPARPGTPGTGHPGQTEALIPGEAPTVYPGQPTRPGTGYPVQPETTYPGQLPTTHPGLPTGPGTSGTAYPGQPSTGYPSQPMQPTRPETSGTGTGYPGTFIPGQPPTVYPGEPTRPETSGTGYPGKPETTYPGQAPTTHPGLLTGPGTSGTAYPGQPSTGYPSQPMQPTRPETSGTGTGYPGTFIPGELTRPGTPGAGYPGQTETVIPGEVVTWYPGHSTRPGTSETGYPQQPDSLHPASLPTSYPGAPTQPSRPETSGTGYPQTETTVSGQFPTGYPGQPSPPGGGGPVFPETQYPQTPVFPSTGQPLQPTQFLGNVGNVYPGKPESEQPPKPSLEFQGQLPIEPTNPGTAGTGIPQKPSPMLGGPSSSVIPGQVTPSRPSLPEISVPDYSQSLGFGSAGQPSTAHPSLPVTSPGPGVSGTHFPQQPVIPGVSLPSSPETSVTSSQKPFEPEYPTVGYFPSPHPPSSTRPPTGISSTPTSQELTTQKPSIIGGTEEPTSTPNLTEDKVSNCGGHQQPPCTTTERVTDSFHYSKPEGTAHPANCLCNPNDVKCMLDCLNGHRQTTEHPFESSTAITTYKPTKPGKPDLFCNCSPFDSECIKKCMESTECDDSQADCSLGEVNPGQPDYPTYPPPACGGPGQEECPYPPAGIKPYPEFTYPTPPPLTPITATEGGFSKTTKLTGCLNNEEGCQATASLEFTSKPSPPSKTTTGVMQTTKPPTYSQPSTFSTEGPKEPGLPTDFNQHFTESGFATSAKPNQGFSPVQKPNEGNFPSEPERESLKPVQPTYSEVHPGQPLQPTDKIPEPEESIQPDGKPEPEQPFHPNEKPQTEEPNQHPEKPNYPSKPEYPEEPSSPDQTPETDSGEEQQELKEPMVSKIPEKPQTDSENEPESLGQPNGPTDFGSANSAKPTTSEEPKPEGEDENTSQTIETQPGDSGYEQEGSNVEQEPKPEQPEPPFTSSKPIVGPTSQPESPDIIHFKPGQETETPDAGLPQFPSGGSTGLPTSAHGERPQPALGPAVSSSPAVPGCDLPSTSCVPDGAPPIYIIPYPVPIVPSPGSCPCYLVAPKNETSDASAPRPPPQTSAENTESFVPQGIIGYIPVVFFPYCPGNNTNADMVQPYFPQAYPVPYPCQQCQHENNPQFTLKSPYIPQNLPPHPARFTDPNLYSPINGGFPNFVQEAKIIHRSQRKSRRRSFHKQEPRQVNSFQQVLKQGNIKSQQIVKSPHRASQYGERLRPIVRF